jgi:hypothetical protein
VVTATVHVQAILRPERRIRQLGIRPVQRADDIGAFADALHDGIRHEIAAALDEPAQGSCADGFARQQISVTPSSSHRQHLAERVGDVADRGARPQHVVAAIEGQVGGLQGESRFELLRDDRPDELAADRKVGVLDGFARGVRPSLRGQIGPPAYAAVGAAHRRHPP